MTVLNCAGKTLDLSRPHIMAVLNVTPDSFSDGGRYKALDKAIAQAECMAEAGADIIDVGGESTRPGAEAVSEAEELARVIPVITALSQRLSIPISIDTSKAVVMQAAADAGAGLINDVKALQGEAALETAAATGLPVCLMHMQGQPDTMQQQPQYDSVVDEVRAFLKARVAASIAAGIPRKQLVVDPGFGFGKTLAHNLALLRQLELLSDGLPILAGLSRKSMIAAITGAELEERLPGSLALALIAAQQGASILRVHDVAETMQALAVWIAVNKVESAA